MRSRDVGKRIALVLLSLCQLVVSGDCFAMPSKRCNDERVHVRSTRTSECLISTTLNTCGKFAFSISIQQQSSHPLPLSRDLCAFFRSAHASDTSSSGSTDIAPVKMSLTQRDHRQEIVDAKPEIMKPPQELML